MEKIIQDKELGTIQLRVSVRAKHYSLKISKGTITAIMPIHGSETHLLTFIEANRSKLLQALSKHPARPLFNEETALQTATFRLHIFRTDRSNFYMKLENERLHIACPEKTDFTEERVQQLLKEFIEKALRHEACRLLPDRLQTLAATHGFLYTGVKIFNSKSHWGSCTGRKSINLSLSLMLLPWHLIDYVLLHELCHTVEMNHSEHFWKLLDKVTGGKAQALKKELKSYHML